jgi:hypothetical protein
MNVEKITMPRAEAVAKMKAYRDALRNQADKEFEQALRAYRALAKGTVLVDPFQAIREAGWDDQFRPKLAMSRADQRRIRLRLMLESRHDGENTLWRSDGVRFESPELTWRSKDRQINVPRMPVTAWTAWMPETPNAQAIVPMIPPDVRPKRGNPKQWYILWEAEWENIPPKDPLLLKPIGGTLYAVLAAWDLTEVERKIIARR